MFRASTRCGSSSTALSASGSRWSSSGSSSRPGSNLTRTVSPTPSRPARHELPAIDEAALVAARHADALLATARAAESTGAPGAQRWAAFLEPLPERLRDALPAELRSRRAPRPRAAPTGPRTRSSTSSPPTSRSGSGMPSTILPGPLRGTTPSSGGPGRLGLPPGESLVVRGMLRATPRGAPAAESAARCACPIEAAGSSIVVPALVVGAIELLSDELLDAALPFPLDTLLVVERRSPSRLIFATLAFRRIDALTGALRRRTDEMEARANVRPRPAPGQRGDRAP